MFNRRCGNTYKFRGALNVILEDALEDTKAGLHRQCFSVNTAKFFRTAFYIEHLGWLLLKT